MSKKELLNETDKQKWERLVGDNITLAHYIDDMISDISYNKTLNSLHVCALLYYIRNNLTSSVNLVLTDNKVHLNYDFVEEAEYYGA